MIIIILFVDKRRWQQQQQRKQNSVLRIMHNYASNIKSQREAEITFSA
jgi:hypothetical protein